MEPTSDEEMELMADVGLLQSELKKAGDPVNQIFEQLFLQSIASKPLAERIRIQKKVDWNGWPKTGQSATGIADNFPRCMFFFEPGNRCQNHDRMHGMHCINAIQKEIYDWSSQAGQSEVTSSADL